MKKNHKSRPNRPNQKAKARATKRANRIARQEKRHNAKRKFWEMFNKFAEGQLQ